MIRYKIDQFDEVFAGIYCILYYNLRLAFTPVEPYLRLPPLLPDLKSKQSES